MVWHILKLVATLSGLKMINHDLIPGVTWYHRNDTRMSKMANIFCMYVCMYVYIYIHITYIYILVGGIPTPLKNMSSSLGMMTFPIYGKIKFMFQTTNQYTYKISLFSGPLWVLNLQFKRINPLINRISSHCYPMIIPLLSHYHPIIIKLLTSIVIP